MFTPKRYLLAIAVCFTLFADAQKLNSELELTKELRGKVKLVKIGWPCPSPEAKKLQNCIEYTIWNLNEQGKLVSILSEQPEGVISTNDIFTYDKKGKKTEWYSYSYAKTRTHYDYDDNSDCLEVINYDSVGKITIKTTCDIHGNETKVDCYDPNGAIISETTTTYFYNDKGLEDSDKRFDANGKLLMIRTFKYDDKGNIVKSMAYKADDNSLMLGDSSKYDQQGNVIEQITFNNVGGIAERTVSKYDNYNNLIEGYYYGLDGTMSWKTIVEYKYDKTGNWIKRTQTDNNGEQVYTRQIEYY